jgi:hypothetical protein
VSGTDGVGTKLKVNFPIKTMHWVDLWSMCSINWSPKRSPARFTLGTIFLPHGPENSGSSRSHYTVGTRSTFSPLKNIVLQELAISIHIDWHILSQILWGLMQTAYLFCKEIPLAISWAETDWILDRVSSVQEGLTFSMHPVCGTRLGVGQKVQILVILILAKISQNALNKPPILHYIFSSPLASLCCVVRLQGTFRNRWGYFNLMWVQYNTPSAFLIFAIWPILCLPDFSHLWANGCS